MNNREQDKYINPISMITKEHGNYDVEMKLALEDL